MRRALLLLVALAGCGKVFGGEADDRPSKLHATASGGEVCATKGAITVDGDAVQIRDPAVRAVVPRSQGDRAAMTFTYHGVTEQVSELASGDVRRQLGLKLRAEDGCNLIYVMWRLTPKPGIEVQTKRTAGARTHKDCGTEGYTRLKPDQRGPLPGLRDGETHTLQAEIDGDQLRAFVDDKLVWQGRLDEAAQQLRGPAGFRTDNVSIDLTLETAPLPEAAATPSIPGCGAR